MPTVNNWKNSFTVQDLYSRLKAIYPLETKTGEETAGVIHQFAGTTHRIHKLYSDNSGEINLALKKLGIMPQNSLPGEPQTNAVAERLNGDIKEGARAALIRAGLPACFWSFAAQHYCIMDNTHYTHDAPSPWCK